VKILIAEDSATQRQLLASVLKKWGYEVQAVEDGNQAVEALAQPDAPRLALLDWMMPGMTGPEVCQHVRKTDPGAYLILLTARDEKEDVAAGLDQGADDYVTKPWNRHELRARLDAGTRILTLQEELARRVFDLEAAMQHVKTLQGLLPICMHCHRIRQDDESWERIDSYIQQHSDATFSHGLCPECLDKYYPEDPDDEDKVGDAADDKVGDA
jgi:phosphoserine phosphatase RsbU/P